MRVEISGCYTEKTLKRQARCLNCEKALESKLLPNYSDRYPFTTYRSINPPIYSGLNTAEGTYRGHGTADWSGQVEEAIVMMDVSCLVCGLWSVVWSVVTLPGSSR